MQRGFDPILVEVIKNEIASVNEEMGIAVHRTGRSAMVKVGDFATAVCDRLGRIVGEGASPFQSGVFATVVKNILAKYGDTLRPGDIIITNDPFIGMGHLPDVAIFAPVFWHGEVVAHTISYSHHMDIGGRFPGGFSSKCTSSYEEGLRIPICKLYDRGVRNESLVATLEANVRGFEDWIGDIDAKIAGSVRGQEEIEAILNRYGPDAYHSTCDYLIDYAETSMREAIAAIPDGEYVQEDTFEDEGLGENVMVPLRIALRVKGDTLVVDFTGTAKQSPMSINLPLGSTLAGVWSSLKALVSPDVITNVGITRPMEVIAPPGSLINPVMPAGTGGRTALIFRVTDMMFRLIAKAKQNSVGIPGEGGDMIHFSGTREGGGHFSCADLYFGGWGGRPGKDGIDCVAPMTFGSYGTVPAEVLEREYPVVIDGFGLVRDTEGPGEYRGAMGVFKQWRFLAPGAISVRTNRLTQASDGMYGGQAGALSLNVMIAADGTETVMRPQTYMHLNVKPGDKIYHRVSASGGYGDPLHRDPSKIAADIREGKLSIERAREVYKIAVDPVTLLVDTAATESLRGRRSA